MDENLIKRIPPNSAEAEKSVLGAMLLSEEALSYAAENLIPEDFYNQNYGIIFKAISSFSADGAAVDTVTLQARLKEMGASDAVCDVGFLSDLAAFVPSPRMIKDYCDIVADNAVIRRLIKASEDIAARGYMGKESAEQQLEAAEKQVFDILRKRTESDFVPIKDIVLSTLDRISEASKRGSSISGVPSGFSDLDDLTSGFQPATLVLVAARPAMGKTAFALNIALHAAIKKKFKVAVFNLEMKEEELMMRFLAMESRINSRDIKSGKLDPSGWELVVEAGGELGDSGLDIMARSDLNVRDLRSICRKKKLESGLDMVIIDYLQLMSAVRKSDSRQQEISEISRALKLLSMELEIPVIALSQLSRDVEKRADHKPMLSDLRESGAIEQDADIVMFIHREEVFNATPENHNLATLMVSKHRNGEIGEINLVWQPEITRFASRIKEE